MEWADFEGTSYFLNQKKTRGYRLAYTGLNIKLPQDSKVEINGFYMTKFLEEFLTISPIGGLSIGASKSFWDKRGRISVNVNDVFYTQPNKFVIDFANIIVNLAQRNDTRNARVTFRLYLRQYKSEKYPKAFNGFRVGDFAG